jgi:hypothetical protein
VVVLDLDADTRALKKVLKTFEQTIKPMSHAADP